MKSNELKKGDKVILTCGYLAEIMDSKKGNIRLANIETNFQKKMCRVFVWDIDSVLEHKNGNLLFKKIDLNPAQQKAREISIKTFSFLYPKSQRNTMRYKQLKNYVTVREISELLCRPKITIYKRVERDAKVSEEDLNIINDYLFRKVKDIIPGIYRE